VQPGMPILPSPVDHALNGDGVRRSFLNLATGGCAHVDVLELSGHHVERNTEGLLSFATSAATLSASSILSQGPASSSLQSPRL
jgi:hypothetical protein